MDIANIVQIPERALYLPYKLDSGIVFLFSKSHIKISHQWYSLVSNRRGEGG